jgi:Na+(H+)/acetate symporter ActP
MNGENGSSQWPFGRYGTIVMMGVVVVAVVILDIYGFVYGLAFAVIVGSLTGLVFGLWYKRERRH